MDTDALREDLFFLVGYILTSVHGLYHEPAEYGIYRLLEAGRRLLSIMEAHGLSEDYLRRLCEEIEEEQSGSMDDERQKETISRLALEYAQELQRRLGSD